MGVVEQAIRELRNWQDCPACGRRVTGPVCPGCRLPLAGDGARVLIQQSEAAARALELRQRTLYHMLAAGQAPAGAPGTVPGVPAAAPPTPRAQAAAGESGRVGGPGFVAASTGSAPRVPVPDPQAPGAPLLGNPSSPSTAAGGPSTAVAGPSRVEVNPVAVFSAVGVGALVAAALVLAFLVPADAGLIRLILLGVTAASAAATLVMRRRRPVSAAAIATGTALLCLLLIGLSVEWLQQEDRLLAAGVLVAGLAVGLGSAGFALRLRPWVSAAMLLAPLAAVISAGGFMRRELVWWADAALFAAVALAAAGRWAAGRWQGAEPGPLPFRVERGLLGLGAALTLLVGVVATLVLASLPDPLQPAAPVLMVAAALAAWLHGTTADSGWRRVAGMAAGLVPVALVFALQLDPLLSTAAAGLGWIVLAAISGLPQLRDGRWAGLLKGGWVAGLLLLLPALGHLLDGMRYGPGSPLDDPSPPVLMLGWRLPEAGYAVAGLLMVAAQCAVATALPPARRGLPGTRAGGGSARPAPAGAPGQRPPLPTPTDPGQHSSPSAHATVAGRLGPEPSGELQGEPSALPAPESAVLRMSRWLSPWLGLIGLAAAASLPVLPLDGSVGLLLVLALGCGLLAWRVGDRVRPVQAAGRIGGGLVILAAAFASWENRPLTLVAGAAVVGLAVGWTRLVPRPLRPVLAGLGYAYALILLGSGLSWYPLGWPADEWTPVAGLLAVAASLVSLAVVLTLPVRDRRTPPPRGPDLPATGERPGMQPAAPGATAYTLLGIGLVPWALAILTVFRDRTWWAAAATAGILAVELTVTARTRPQPTWLRVLAAASLLPTAGVLLINVGAMLIPSSGSPILLPIVAAMAAGTAITAAPAATRIAGIDARAAAPIRGSLEVGALLTALAAVGLAVVLPASGPATALVVCAILAAGAAVVAGGAADRRWVWWLAALAAAGVLWSALVLLDVGLVEAYTLPLGVAAVIVGLRLARQRPRWWALVAAGLQLGLLPSWLLAATGRELLWRAAALTGAALVIGGIALLARRAAPRPLWVLAGGLLVAGTAPLLVALRSSGRLPARDPLLERLLAALDADPLTGFSWVVATAVISAGMLGLAGQVARWATAHGARLGKMAESWRFAPALTVAALGPVLGVREGQQVVIVMWLACLALLAVTVLATRLRLRGRVILPPVWFCWLLALGVGIAGWSLRELRVEFHALPLGLTLLGCGVMAWRGATGSPPSATRSWPIGESNPTLAILPGVLATLGPSTLAIGTDPQTWRAILVLVLALATLLVGARRLWRPCLVTGILDLAVAVLLVFVARRGAIDAVPWLIALVSAGGVLLGLAVYSERRQHLGKP